ncbi:hypothetical protein B0T18DRAFT_105225 [Schizothecium vesticola]|uniref:NADH-ubiquinone oxidoreductase 9.5 kDa subunit n=1 Tax=Schizothecium vesticola TaxID=314040 RepID=A0AA40K876_9PEZI|nr:hypothetical protein B0T18DRAFT_105225 [Schizothecium vesticola]
MSASGPLAPRFWASPLRYCRWAARERPSFFWSVIIGASGPISLLVIPPIRRSIGAETPKPIPMTYPIPSGPRKQLTGYDDDTE